MNNEQFLYYNFWYHCTDIYVVFYPCIFKYEVHVVYLQHNVLIRDFVTAFIKI